MTKVLQFTVSSLTYLYVHTHTHTAHNSCVLVTVANSIGERVCNSSLEQMASTTSITTVGGCTFEELCRRSQRNYACDNTVDIRNISFKQAKKKVIKHINDCICSLEIESDSFVAKFYIGKTFVRRRRKPGGGYLAIDPQRSSTYRKNGIGQRWREHREKYYGKDGMVVLAIITREAVPLATRNKDVHQEDYAFELEQALIQHFKTFSSDVRIANVTTFRGGSDNRASAAYAIYMAYRLEQPQLHNSSEDLVSSTSCKEFVPTNSDEQFTSTTNLSKQQANFSVVLVAVIISLCVFLFCIEKVAAQFHISIASHAKMPS